MAIPTLLSCRSFAVALALSLLWFTGGPAAAALIGPDAAGYRAGNVVSSFENITSPGNALLTDGDDVATSLPIPFPFDFYGRTFNALFVSSNGLITFDAPDTTFSNGNLNTQNVGGGAAIAPLWDDWDLRFQSDGIYTAVLGRAPARRLVIQWNLVEHFPAVNSVDPVTFQVVLSESDDSILFRYDDVIADAGFSNGQSATIGIRDVVGHTNGRRLQFSLNSASVNNGDAILFVPVISNGVVTVRGTASNSQARFVLNGRMARNSGPRVLGDIVLAQLPRPTSGFIRATIRFHRIDSFQVIGNQAFITGRGLATFQNGIRSFNTLTVTVTDNGGGGDTIAYQFGGFVLPGNFAGQITVGP